MDNKLERMLIMQGRNQRETYGYAFNEMNVDQLISYIRDQHQAADIELGEALNETDWKPWTRGERRIRRDEFMNELIDVLHFWLNMVLAVGSRSSAQELADEIFTRFALKNWTNVERQVDGYDGRSTKCGGCGRALDDFAVECRRVGDQGYCAKLDTDLNYLQVTTEQVGPGLLVVAPIKPVVCSECHHLLDKYGCEPPTTERWGNCMAGVGSVKNIPPIKLPTES